LLWIVIHTLQNEPSFSFVGGSTLILTLSCFSICLSVHAANRWISKFQLIRVVLAGLLILKLIELILSRLRPSHQLDILLRRLAIRYLRTRRLTRYVVIQSDILTRFYLINSIVQLHCVQIRHMLVHDVLLMLINLIYMTRMAVRHQPNGFDILVLHVDRLRC